MKIVRRENEHRDFDECSFFVYRDEQKIQKNLKTVVDFC
jgi:hypothetical protein